MNEKSESDTVTARAHPSLALVKYWGKRDGGINIPAVPSVAVTLDTLETTTTVGLSWDAEKDGVLVNGSEEDPNRYTHLFNAIRAIADGGDRRYPKFIAESSNNFPTSAGLASSASGYAALAAASWAAVNRTSHRSATYRANTRRTATVDSTSERTDLPDVRLPHQELPLPELSRIARLGSGSAARSVFGGFTLWEVGAEAAHSLYDASWWPELRILVVPITTGSKAVSSREAMERTRHTSPYFDAWVTDGPVLAERAVEALRQKDLELLGETVRLSYLRMFATMFGADPPITYWLPGSVAVQNLAAELRSQSIPAWETMDAGPQIKILTLRESTPLIVRRLREELSLEPVVCGVGSGVSIVGGTSDG